MFSAASSNGGRRLIANEVDHGTEDRRVCCAGLEEFGENMHWIVSVCLSVRHMHIIWHTVLNTYCL